MYSSEGLPPLTQPRVPPWVGARALVLACTPGCACLGVCVRYCSRVRALSSLRSVGTLSQSYPRCARLVLRSLRSPLSCGGGCAWVLAFCVSPCVLAFFALRCACLCCARLLLSAGTPALSLSLSLFALSTDSSSPLGRSSRFNLPLVPRGIIHHSFTVVFILHTPRSFFSLLLVIF